jgi:hypothetical protein
MGPFKEGASRNLVTLLMSQSRFYVTSLPIKLKVCNQSILIPANIKNV